MNVAQKYISHKHWSQWKWTKSDKDWDGQLRGMSIVQLGPL